MTKHVRVRSFSVGVCIVAAVMVLTGSNALGDEPTGACCFPNGGCSEASEPVCVDTLKGVFQGEGIDCATANCPLAKGACCYFDGYCDWLTESFCTQTGGKYKGDNTNCHDVRCEKAPGAGSPPSVPAMNRWGLIAFVVLLAVSYVWFARRKPKV